MGEAACRTPTDVKDRVPHLAGKGMGWTKGHWASRIVAFAGVKSILEIGTSHGCGTCYFAATGARVTTVDCELAEPSVHEALGQCGLAADVVLGRSDEVLSRFVLEGRSWDLIYIDGGHELPDVLVDCLLADRLLAPGGWLILDDTENGGWPDVAAVWKLVRQWPGYELHPSPHTWGIARKR